MTPQTKAVYAILKKERWAHTTKELQNRTGQTRVPARIHDMRAFLKDTEEIVTGGEGYWATYHLKRKRHARN